MKAKMHTLKRLAALSLTAAMALSLAACGGGKSADAAEGAPQAGSTEGAEYIYAPSFTPIVEAGDEELAPLLLTEEGLYYLTLETVGDATPEGVTPEYEGQYAIKEVRLGIMDFNGESTRLEAYTPLKSAHDAEGMRDYTSLAHPEAATVDSKGRLIFLEQINTSWSTAPAEITSDMAEYFDYAQSETESYIRVLDKSGNEQSLAKIDLDPEAYVSGIYTDAQANIVIPQNGSGRVITAYTANGEKVYELAAEGYLYGAAKLRGGDVACMSYESGSEYYIRIADSAAGEFATEAYTLPLTANELVSADGAGAEYDLYYTTPTGLCGYTLESGESTDILSWVDNDVSASELSFITVGADGLVRGLIAGYDKNDNMVAELVTLEKIPRESVKEKEHLSLATVSGTDELYDAVIRFNRASEKYHVDVKDYNAMLGGSSYAEAAMKLKTELMAGDTPDLLDLTDLPYSHLAARGLLEDLYPYIDADNELSREDFFENILSAYEVNGRLYSAVAGFGITSVMGAQSVVGDTPGWTYEDYYAALASMPEGCEGFDWFFTKETALNYAMMMDHAAYVDWASGQCRFDSEEFIALLEFANQFKSNEEMESYETSAEDGAAYRISQGQQMLTQCTLYSFNETSNDNPFNTAITYIGFPNAAGKNGSAINAMEQYAMTASCRSKEAAWEFLRSFLTEEYQLEGYYYPTNKAAFESLMAEATEIKYETDDYGHILLDENGEKKRLVIGMMYDGTTTSEIYSGMSGERAQAIMALIASADTAAELDSSIIDIVISGAQAYFAGQKTAAEAARLIQSKASIYVNEQK